MVNQMHRHKFIEALRLAASSSTVYMWGTFGNPVTNALITAKQRQYSDWYTAGKIASLKALSGKSTAFDCVGLIKGILWGWTSTDNPKYSSGGVPDISANSMIKVCTGVSSDFKTIIQGEAVWLPGHIGVYIGDGLVIEATPAWKNGVQITKLLQRKWKVHGKLPWVNYIETGVRLIVDGKEVKAEIQNNVTVASVRDMASALGATVNWDENTRTVTVTGR